MSGRVVKLPVDYEGNIKLWKAVVGGRTSHRMSSPLFPRYKPNYSFDHGVLLRVKEVHRPGSVVALDEEYARRKNRPDSDS